MSKIYSIHLNDLETILMYAVGGPASLIGAWKPRLSLLGVCRLWTNILYPIVYRTAYIESGERINGSQFCKWNTNIDCIASRGCHHVVNTLRIKTHHNVDAAWSASQLIKILNFNKMDWSKIRRLQISIMFDDTQSVYKKYSKLESNEINDLAHKFSRYMPSVKELTLFEQGVYGISISGFKILVLAYAPQLRQLSMYTCFTTSQLHLPAQLTSLCIDMWPQRISSLTSFNVFARTLQRLVLRRLPKNYDWSPFYDYITPGHIYFDSLRWLEISYTSRHNSDMVQSLSYAPSCPYILHFPKLQTLKLYGCPPKCILLSAEFPTHYLTRLSIDDRRLEVMYKKIYTIKARQLYVRVRSNSPYNSTYYLAMNSAFGKLANFTKRGLQIPIQKTAFDYEMLQWGYLDNMSLYFTTPIQTLKLLSRTPRLSRLSVYRLQFSGYLSFSAIEHAAELWLKLKTLKIIQISGNSPRSAALAFIQGLITRATELQELVVPADYKHDVIFIIGRMKRSMPHLGNIGVYSKANQPAQMQLASFFSALTWK